jgi:hypothetical protein
MHGVAPGGKLVKLGQEKYAEHKDTRCAAHASLDAREIFGTGDTEEGMQPIPSIPRKLLK